MTNKIKSRLLINFFGPDYLTDERIQAGTDKAGNYCFFLTMFLLWLAMLYGLLSGQIELAVIPFIIFFINSIFYLILRVKSGSFQAVKNKAQSKTRIILRWFLIGALYASLLFLFKLRDIETFTSSNILPLIISCIVGAILWVFLFIFITRFLIKKNDNVLNKKMDVSD